METPSALQTQTVKNIKRFMTLSTIKSLTQGSFAYLPSVRLSLYDKPAFYQNG